MINILLTTAYFAPISYYAAIANADKILIEANEHYQKKSYRSRCYIAGSHGKQMLNIPIIRPNGNQTMIKNAILGTTENWQNQHWNSIITSYNSSPFLLYYRDEIEAVLLAKYDNLWELNKACLNLMMDLLQLDAEINYTTEFEKDPKEYIDMRNSISIKNTATIENYTQVFGDKHGFLADLSILDLLFNLGPDAGYYLTNNLFSIKR